MCLFWCGTSSSIDLVRVIIDLVHVIIDSAHVTIDLFHVVLISCVCNYFIVIQKSRENKFCVIIFKLWTDIHGGVFTKQAFCI